MEQIYPIFLESSGICTDTRHLQKDNLFVALKGPNFNANSFAAQAIDQGAIGAIIDDKVYAIPGKTILIKDGLAALQELARIHRKKINIPVIGITGSNGKTTTKELIHAVLQTTFETFATQGNLNNHIGVPLSVLSIRSHHQMAVIEMGANHLGEIAFLSNIAHPTHGLITNIGKAHTGLFGGFEGVIRAKSELYDFLIKNKGVVFINQHQELLMNMSKRIKKGVFYPEAGSDCPCELVSADPMVIIKTATGQTVNTNLIGSYNFDNIATALCVAKFFEVPEARAASAVAAYMPDNNRSQIIKKHGNSIILDAYNANPSSMEKALQNLSGIRSAHKVAIIGDMFELGEDTASEHRLIGEMLKNMDLQEIYFCGESMKNAYDAFGGGYYFKTKQMLKEHLSSHQFKDATILIKASRGMALEDLLEAI